MTSSIPCIFCQTEVGLCPPEWLCLPYFASVSVGLSAGTSLIYIQPQTQCAPLCSNCLGVINTYNLIGSLSGTDISYDQSQISLAINAVIAVNSLTLPPTHPILTREQTSPINIPGSEVKNAWW